MLPVCKHQACIVAPHPLHVARPAMTGSPAGCCARLPACLPACSDGDAALKTNFEAEQPSSWFAELYQEDGLTGGHVIMLGADEASRAAALGALGAYPGGLQLGGGVTTDNAREWLDAGASHVIVTSFVFRDGKLEEERLADLVRWWHVPGGRLADGRPRQRLWALSCSFAASPLAPPTTAYCLAPRPLLLRVLISSWGSPRAQFESSPLLGPPRQHMAATTSCPNRPSTLTPHTLYHATLSGQAGGQGAAGAGPELPQEGGRKVLRRNRPLAEVFLAGTKVGHGLGCQLPPSPDCGPSQFGWRLAQRPVQGNDSKRYKALSFSEVL